jgi:hypothetical protein
MRRAVGLCNRPKLRQGLSYEEMTGAVLREVLDLAQQGERRGSNWCLITGAGGLPGRFLQRPVHETS